MKAIAVIFAIATLLAYLVCLGLSVVAGIVAVLSFANEEYGSALSAVAAALVLCSFAHLIARREFKK